jgi:hypothetical protein
MFLSHFDTTAPFMVAAEESTAILDDLIASAFPKVNMDANSLLMQLVKER